MATTQIDPATDPKRQAEIERTQHKREALKTNRDWLKTFGTIVDDEFSREAWALGEEYRKAQSEP